MAICFTVAQAAQELGVSKSFMYSNLLESPDFPAIHRGGRWLIPCAALERWADEQAHAKMTAQQVSAVEMNPPMKF